jgi:uncharacterized protein (TIGR00266 family)
MKFEIKYKPSYSMLVVNLEAGEWITGEGGAMSYMTPTIDVRTRTREKSILGSLATALIGGQTLFVNDYIASRGAGEIALVAAPVGDITKLDLQPGAGYIIQKSSYLASSQQVDLDVRWEGFSKGIFGQGLFMIKTSGQGDLFINTFGAIDKHTLQPGQELIVDNFHLVAFSDSCDYRVEKIGGWKETILSGEGLVTRIRGPGEVYIQTKNIREFAEWMWSLIEPRVQAGSRSR